MSQTPQLVDGMLRCVKCGVLKILGDFPKSRRKKLGVRSRCKSCCNEANRLYYRREEKAVRERQSAFNRTEHRRAYARKYQRERHRRIRDEMATRPRPEGCEICGNAPAYFDHDHTSGAFRGWLCINCNTALGYAKDNPVVLRALADYLEQQVKEDAA
jgi:hypothetical protein